jgi:hypothetical protein
MRVDEAGQYEAAGRVDHLGARGRGQAGADGGYQPVLDEQVGVAGDVRGGVGVDHDTAADEKAHGQLA